MQVHLSDSSEGEQLAVFMNDDPRPERPLLTNGKRQKEYTQARPMFKRSESQRIHRVPTDLSLTQMSCLAAGWSRRFLRLALHRLEDFAAIFYLSGPPRLLLPIVLWLLVPLWRLCSGCHCFAGLWWQARWLNALQRSVWFLLFVPVFSSCCFVRVYCRQSHGCACDGTNCSCSTCVFRWFVLYQWNTPSHLTGDCVSRYSLFTCYLCNTTSQRAQGGFSLRERGVHTGDSYSWEQRQHRRSKLPVITMLSEREGNYLGDLTDNMSWRNSHLVDEDENVKMRGMWWPEFGVLQPCLHTYYVQKVECFELSRIQIRNYLEMGDMCS
jgi:hypothetical protein